MPYTTSRRGFLQIAISTLLFSGCQRGGSPPHRFVMQSPWVNDAEFIGYFVGLDQGLYKGENLDLTYQPGGPDIIAEGALLSKRADIALTPIETTINLIARDGAPLKIIGTQYQKSPLGIVSLAKNGIKKPQDLVGKTLAVPPANVLTVEAMLKLNGLKKSDIRIVPYQYDPTPLLRGEVDATVDFVTNVPYTIQQAGGVPTSFLIYDYGFQVYNDTVVVTEDTLKSRRGEIVSWLRASRQGWVENFRDPAHYPPLFENSYFRGTGRTVQNEIFFNNAQKPLIEAASGIFSMTDSGINANIESLQRIGIAAKQEMFFAELVDDL